MAVTSISHISPQALTGLQEAAPKPAAGQTGDAKQAKARPAIGGPLSGLAPPAAKPRTAPTGSGPRPLGMPAQRLKIKGLPSAASTTKAHAPTSSATFGSKGGAAPTHATANPGSTDTPDKPASEPPTDVESAFAASQQAALDMLLMQNAMSQIQNQVSINQAQNSLREELGKGVKALSQ